MSPQLDRPIVAVDVGNSCVKMAWFEGGGDCGETKPATLPITCVPGLPVPTDTLQMGPKDEFNAQLSAWLAEHPLAASAAWWIASVHRGHAARLRDAVRTMGVEELRDLRHEDLPLCVRTETPERVGIDRLAAAVAVNAIRSPDRAAILVDHGSAITVDLVNVDGGFEGGAILPGVAMSARALQEQTDALPRSPSDWLADPPPVLGRSTMSAIESGLFWGAIGAVREIVIRLADSIDAPTELFLSGGAAPQIADFWQDAARPARFVPHLVLSGVALTAAHQ